MRHLTKIVIFLLLLRNIKYSQASNFKFNKITCESKDVAFATSEYCLVKEKPPNDSLLSVKFNLHQLPIKDITMKMNFMVKSYGTWVSYLYNLDIDVCKFLQRRYNSIMKLVYGILESHTNMNHACPYNHDVSLDNISSLESSRQLRGMPLAKGHYKSFIKWIVGNKTRVEVSVYFEFT